ncbi:hypothetical protein ACE1CI_32065 [Aerosakkonemataceae cyanobacterium BLCC-F50]|uniref:Uncharacterized protein n=1 Tax=Floridaenema flaviceps BLCC-F50 TaxID=3153642 RepID=A0ABV4Y0Q9_9CYAN
MIRHIEDAHRLLHRALEAAILKRKPVYIEIACNLATVPIPKSVPLQLKRHVESNPVALEAAVTFKRIHEPPLPAQTQPGEAALTTRAICEQVQSILTGDSALLVETGDSWFNGQKITLPDGCLYEF